MQFPDRRSDEAQRLTLSFSYPTILDIEKLTLILILHFTVVNLRQVYCMPCSINYQNYQLFFVNSGFKTDTGCFQTMYKDFYLFFTFSKKGGISIYLKLVISCPLTNTPPLQSSKTIWMMN